VFYFRPLWSTRLRVSVTPSPSRGRYRCSPLLLTVASTGDWLMDWTNRVVSSQIGCYITRRFSSFDKKSKKKERKKQKKNLGADREEEGFETTDLRQLLQELRQTPTPSTTSRQNRSWGAVEIRAAETNVVRTDGRPPADDDVSPSSQRESTPSLRQSAYTPVLISGDRYATSDPPSVIVNYGKQRVAEG
jgi:hypothetical protein